MVLLLFFMQVVVEAAEGTQVRVSLLQQMVVAVLVVER
jgi:hypothetical protein